MTPRDVVLCHPVRTAIGAYNGSLKDVPATELGAITVRETLARAGLAPERIGSVVMGNVIQAGNKMIPAPAAHPRATRCHPGDIGSKPGRVLV
jgi:acetyl-CoA C-acetyltransferase